MIKITHRPEGQWALSDSYMEAEAARLGLGLAYVPVELVADDLEHGKLIRVLQRYSLRMEDCFSITLIATSPRPADGH